MVEEQKKIPRTAVSVQQATKKRLQAHMRYGETVDGMINKILDFYEKESNIEVMNDIKRT
jgi:hypothetical protein